MPKETGSPTPSPTIYWVAGNGTNVGKTTIAVALIRELNARGIRTIGFKPFAGSIMRDLVDFMIETYPKVSSKLFGSDAWKLTKASPLTDVDCLDLVVPIQFLSYPGWRDVIVMRSGSTLLGNVEFAASRYGHRLKDRADFRYIIEKSGLPLAGVPVTDSIDFRFAATVAPHKPQHAFERLLDLDVDAVVCEGAAQWLPIWQGCPPVNHAILISDGTIRLFPNIDLSVPFLAEHPMRSARPLIDSLTRRRAQRYAIPYFLTEQDRRDGLARDLVRMLLDKAELSAAPLETVRPGDA